MESFVLLEYMDNLRLLRWAWMGMDVHMVFFKFLVVRLDDSRMKGVCNQTAYLFKIIIIVIISFFSKYDIYL